MYRVSKDARIKKSADALCRGLESCLQEKPLNKLHAKTIYERAGVSRATFYRLFDGINDIFSYECDTILFDILKMVRSKTFADKNALSYYCAMRWLSHETLMKTLAENDLIGIFVDSHRRNSDLLREFYPVPLENTEQLDYFASILASLCFAAISIYFKHGAQEEIEKVYHTVCRCTAILAETMNQ